MKNVFMHICFVNKKTFVNFGSDLKVTLVEKRGMESMGDLELSNKMHEIIR
jgi:hypothetical protein